MKHIMKEPARRIVISCWRQGLAVQTTVTLLKAVVAPNREAVTEAITEIYDEECELKYDGPLADYCRDVRYAMIDYQQTWPASN